MIDDVRDQLAHGNDVTVHNATRDEDYRCAHRLSRRQAEDVLAGGVIPRLANQS